MGIRCNGNILRNNSSLHISDISQDTEIASSTRFFSSREEKRREEQTTCYIDIAGIGWIASRPS